MGFSSKERFFNKKELSQHIIQNIQKIKNSPKDYMDTCLKYRKIDENFNPQKKSIKLSIPLNISFFQTMKVVVQGVYNKIISFFEKQEASIIEEPKFLESASTYRGMEWECMSIITEIKNKIQTLSIEKQTMYFEILERILNSEDIKMNLLRKLYALQAKLQIHEDHFSLDRVLKSLKSIENLVKLEPHNDKKLFQSLNILYQLKDYVFEHKNDIPFKEFLKIHDKIASILFEYLLLKPNMRTYIIYDATDDVLIHMMKSKIYEYIQNPSILKKYPDIYPTLSVYFLYETFHVGDIEKILNVLDSIDEKLCFSILFPNENEQSLKEKQEEKIKTIKKLK